MTDTPTTPTICIAGEPSDRLLRQLTEADIKVSVRDSEESVKTMVSLEEKMAVLAVGLIILEQEDTEPQPLPESLDKALSDATMLLTSTEDCGDLKPIPPWKRWQEKSSQGKPPRKSKKRGHNKK